MLKFNSNTRKPRQDTERSRPLSVCFDVFKTSVKGIFSKQREIEHVNDASSAPVPAVHDNSVQRPHIFQFDIMDAEALKGLQYLYEALHDPSILDARRHRRYNLYPLVISVVAETPVSPVVLDVVSPRCRRSLVLYGISASTIRSSPELVLSSSSAIFASDSDSEALATVPTPITDEPRVMNVNDFQILRFLGEGTSGKVYYVKDRISEARVALKVVPKAKKSEYTLSIAIQERDISKKLSDSPWFVNLWAAWHDDANLYIAMTAYPTDLDSEMIRCGVIDPERARFYMAEIIIALEELHSRGIIHRDVKSPNILIDHQGHIVLADFGLSKDFCEKPTFAERVYQPYWPYLRDENPTSETEPRDPEELHFVAWDYRGSELEMAPEIHLRQPYSFGVDFWSAAIVLYWMLTGRPPFYEDEDEGEADIKLLPYKIAEDDLYWDPEDNIDDDTIDFLERMLTKNPKKRLMISYEMPSHPYFSGVNWTLMEERKVPPPWVPECEVCHVYEQTSPNFVPGTPYVDVDLDPYPEFNYMSEEAARMVATDSEADLYSDLGDDSDTVTDVEIMRIGSYEDLSFGYQSSTAPTTPDRTDNHEARTLLCGDSNDGESIKQSWDVTIINPPSTKPCGPGPKQWLQVQDLLKLAPTPSSAAKPIISAPQVLCFTPAKLTLSIDLESRLCPPPSYRLKLVDALYPDSPQVPLGQKSTRIVNGTGIMFKVKVWISQLWTPKPKRGSGLKRLSLLS